MRWPFAGPVGKCSSGLWARRRNAVAICSPGGQLRWLWEGPAGNYGGGERDRRATTAAVSGHGGKSSGDWKGVEYMVQPFQTGDR